MELIIPEPSAMGLRKLSQAPTEAACTSEMLPGGGLFFNLLALLVYSASTIAPVKKDGPGERGHLYFYFC
jgi:hypothetical protein